jgi:hypothetical protein
MVYYQVFYSALHKMQVSKICFFISKTQYGMVYVKKKSEELNRLSTLFNELT